MQIRYSQRVMVECSVMFADDSGDVGEGRVVNLSLPGCLLESSENFSFGGYVQLRLFLPDRQVPLQVSLAAVRWVEGSRAGVEFIRTSQDEQARLERFVRERVGSVEASVMRNEVVVKSVVQS